MAQFEVIEFEGQKIIKAMIQNETIRAESGALHYMRGQIEMTSKAPGASKLLKSLVSGENVFRPTYTGTGEIYFGPPIFGEYVVLQLNNEEWILDQGAYVCSDMGIEVDVHRNAALTGMMGGEGLFQTKVSGTGTVVMQGQGKVQAIDLAGETLSVDGGFAIARTSGVQYAVKRASKSLVGSFTSGEGLVNTFTGTGADRPRSQSAPEPHLPDPDDPDGGCFRWGKSPREDPRRWGRAVGRRRRDGHHLHGGHGLLDLLGFAALMRPAVG